MLKFIAVLLTLALSSSFTQTDAPLRHEVDALNAAMVAGLKRDPVSVGAYYSDNGAIIGAGQRHQGRAAIDEYWRGGAMFADWKLEVLAAGGPTHAPWQYGRSVLHGRSGRTMETFFLALMRRQSSGELKYDVDVFTRESGTGGEAEAAKLTGEWLQAVESGDAATLQRVFDDQFVIISSTGAKTKAQEIAELVREPGRRLPYFKSENTASRGFGALAITTGILSGRCRNRGAGPSVTTRRSRSAGRTAGRSSRSR